MSRPKPPEDPKKLSEQALRIISQELDYLEEKVKQGKLEPQDSACLTKYADSLHKYVKTDEEDAAVEKRRLAKMSTAELTKMAEELAAKGKEKSGAGTP